MDVVRMTLLDGPHGSDHGADLARSAVVFGGLAVFGGSAVVAAAAD